MSASSSTTPVNKPCIVQSSFCHGGACGFDPHQRARDPDVRREVLDDLARDDFRGATLRWFQLPAGDNWVYHAKVRVTLDQAQAAVEAGRANGLRDWYIDDDGAPFPIPEPRADIEAYIDVFRPETSTVNALRTLGANAKKKSTRARVAAHLASKRYVHPERAATLGAVRRCRRPPPNPYFDFWAWSCRALEWAGPCSPYSERRQESHHVLPVLMHHFGCVCPSYEALEVLRLVADGRPIADVGCGNGYWTFALQEHGIPAARLLPVDNSYSTWRSQWVSRNDMDFEDGDRWLENYHRTNGDDLVLLVVYPIVYGPYHFFDRAGSLVRSNPDGRFLRGLLAAYRGDTIAVVATQNHNGYTAFRSMTFDEYMEREQAPEWVKVVQLPLPSFAGKDEALFVYQRGARAPKA